MSQHVHKQTPWPCTKTSDLAPWAVAGTVTCTSSVSPRHPSTRKNACWRKMQTAHFSKPITHTQTSISFYISNAWGKRRCFFFLLFFFRLKLLWSGSIHILQEKSTYLPSFHMTKSQWLTSFHHKQKSLWLISFCLNKCQSVSLVCTRWRLRMSQGCCGSMVCH